MRVHRENMLEYLHMALAQSKKIDADNKLPFKSIRTAALQELFKAVTNGEEIEFLNGE